MRVLGIETSCDETGVAVYDSRHGLLGHKVYSQIPLHSGFGGVVPELASRDHVRKLAPMVDALLVIGAPNSSNSKRLVEVGSAAGCSYSQLVQRARDIDWRALEGIRSVGVTAGASAPEVLIEEVIDAFRARFDVTVEQVETAQENVEFKVPRVLRDPV